MEHRSIELNKHLLLPKVINNIIKKYDRFFFGKEILSFHPEEFIKGLVVISNQSFATFSYYKRIFIYNNKGEIQHTLSFDQEILNVHVWEDNLVIVFVNDYIRIYNLKTDTYFDLEDNEISHSDIKDDLLLTNSNMWKLKVWNLEKRTCILELNDITGCPRFLPDSSIICKRKGQLVVLGQKGKILQQKIQDISSMNLINGLIIINLYGKIIIYTQQLEHLYTSKEFSSHITKISISENRIFIGCELDSYMWDLKKDIVRKIKKDIIYSDTWFIGNNMHHFPDGRLLLFDGLTIKIFE